MNRRCPTPQKIAYTTRYDAGTAMAAMIRRRAPHAATGAYKCNCGAWHLTTKPRTLRRRP